REIDAERAAIPIPALEDCKPVIPDGDTFLPFSASIQRLKDIDIPGSTPLALHLSLKAPKGKGKRGTPMTTRTSRQSSRVMRPGLPNTTRTPTMSMTARPGHKTSRPHPGQKTSRPVSRASVSSHGAVVSTLWERPEKGGALRKLLAQSGKGGAMTHKGPVRRRMTDTVSKGDRERDANNESMRRGLAFREKREGERFVLDESEGGVTIESAPKASPKPPAVARKGKPHRRAAISLSTSSTAVGIEVMDDGPSAAEAQDERERGQTVMRDLMRTKV
ncbi:hypothetical protein KIPB_008612, partial [Kipferlia bialata]